MSDALVPGRDPESPARRCAWNLYLEDIRRTRVLAAPEEARLLRLAAAGDLAARDALVAANLRFVLRLALQYRNPSLPPADLVNEGCLGLLRALRTFDPGAGVRFLSYAECWIRASMLRALGRGKPPLRPEAGAVIGEEDGEASPGDGPEPEEPQPASYGMPAPRCAEMIAKLPAREAQVLRWLYSLDHGPALSLREVGGILGVSHQRVRQLRDQAFRRLRPAWRHWDLRGQAG